jgi:hypothetical protein
MYLIESAPMLLGGLAAGVAFGVLLQKGQVTKYRVIVGQLLLTDHTMARVMGAAVVVGAIGVYSLLGLGWIDALMVKPAPLAAVALGGGIFGVGMAVLGYCPGTAVGAMAEGSRHAVFGVIGGIIGAAAYAEAWPALHGLLALANLGRVTLPDVTGVPAAVWITVLMLAAFGGFVSLDRWERRRSAGP